MSNIQGNVNQVLGTSAVLLNLNPTLRDAVEKRTEERQLAKKEEVLNKKIPLYGKDYDALVKEPNLEKGKDFYDSLQDPVSEKYEIAKRRFDINPTEETYEKLKDSKKRLKKLQEINKSYENPLISKQINAERVLQDKRKAKEEQMKKLKTKVKIINDPNKGGSD